MNVWKAVKRITYTGMSAPFAAFALLVGTQPMSPSVAQILDLILDLIMRYPVSTLVLVASWYLLCPAVWLLADVRERLDAFAKKVPLLVRNRNLQPHHFGLVGYHPYYHLQPEYIPAANELEQQST